MTEYDLTLIFEVVVVGLVVTAAVFGPMYLAISSVVSAHMKDIETIDRLKNNKAIR